MTVFSKTNSLAKTPLPHNFSPIAFFSSGFPCLAGRRERVSGIARNRCIFDLSGYVFSLYYIFI